MTRLPLTYVLPLRTDEPVDELATYLAELAGTVDEVIVVDGSDPEVAAEHRRRFPDVVRVVPPATTTRNGKVGGVLTGLALASCPAVVVADDDVRYDRRNLEQVLDRLGRADVVRPQNYFSPRPWHAVVDGARSCLNRAVDGDWPGTLALRRDALLAAGGYDGDAMFENLELVRTIRAHGGTEHVALDVFVRRVPPTARHFARQQVRQAYDELARPVRLAASLAVLPALAVALRRRRRPAVLAAAGAVALAAESGRRRAGGRRYFPAASSALSPAWLCWRSACSWVALGSWGRGGVPYRGDRLPLAAHRTATLRRRAPDRV